MKPPSSGQIALQQSGVQMHSNLVQAAGSETGLLEKYQ